MGLWLSVSTGRSFGHRRTMHAVSSTLRMRALLSLGLTAGLSMSKFFLPDDNLTLHPASDHELEEVQVLAHPALLSASVRPKVDFGPSVPDQTLR